MIRLSWQKILGILFLVLTVSCISTKNCVVYEEKYRDDFVYKGFDTTYSSIRSLKDKWILKYLDKANLKGLSDSLIILVCTSFFTSPTIDVKSDSIYSHTYFKNNVPITEYSTTPIAINKFDSIFYPAALNWDIHKLKHLLKCGTGDSFGRCHLVKLVRHEKKISSWTEYIFCDLVFWQDCDTIAVDTKRD